MKVIRISDAVHEHLKQVAKREGRTLQWVVEQRLTGLPQQRLTEDLISAPINIGAQDFGLPEYTPSKDIEFEAFLAEYSVPNQKKPPHPKYGYPCCHEDKPCRHWQWDTSTGEGYVNTLTGEVK